MTTKLRVLPVKPPPGVALVRLDFNAEDDSRMRAALPTLQRLLKARRTVVILSHRGRPSGFDARLSLRGDARKLARLLRRPVEFIPHFHAPSIREKVQRAPKGTVFLLENVRFVRGERTAVPEFAQRVATLGTFFVNDAFAVSHREADSVSGIEEFLPSFAGLSLAREVEALSRVVRAPRQPLVLVLGGLKAADKLPVLSYFKAKARWILLGGAAANTALYLRKVDVNGSARETDTGNLKTLRGLLRSRKVVVPQDWKMSQGEILDIGPKTAAQYAKILKSAGTVVWNGPMGLVERKAYAAGTRAVARAIAANRKAFSVAGGGETVTFLKKVRLEKKFSFVSTGGGAMLEFLSGKKLPGIEALKVKK